MDKERATELLAALADGVNPLTGELLPEDCICNCAEIVRAFHCILNELNFKKTSQQKKKLDNSGKPWNEEDDQVLIRMFDEGQPKKDIEKYFKRTKGGIAARLVRLGKISERDDYRHK